MLGLAGWSVPLGEAAAMAEGDAPKKKKKEKEPWPDHPVKGKAGMYYLQYPVRGACGAAGTRGSHSKHVLLGTQVCVPGPKVCYIRYILSIE